MIEALIHGLLLAGGLILPLGAQNLFIFNQGANQPRLIRALPAVLTAALCDTLMVILAVLGVSVVVFTFAWLRMILLGAGTLFLLYMGWTVWRSAPSDKLTQDELSSGIRKQVLFAASVSLLNPHAILDTVVVIGMNSLGYNGADRAAFAIAVIAVSWLWFISLAAAGRILRRLDTTGGWMKLINKVSAILIWGTAVYMVWQLAK